MTHSQLSLRIGARGSKLSLTQTEWVAAQLRAAHPDLHVELVIIQTTGDKLRDISLAVLGGQGVFTKEIERALLEDRIDVAVHSLKDLPTTLGDGLALTAITRREEPNDCLVAAREVDLRSLGTDQPIGTSSLRRQAQLLRMNPALKIVELRGNVPTRIEKMMRGEAAAVVLAAAGMNRLEIHPPWKHIFSFEEMLPAPGQGALGLETRENDAFSRTMLEALNDSATSAECRAERAFLRAFGGGCRAPIAALGRVHDGVLALDGLIASADAAQYFRGQIEGAPEQAEALGTELAERLMREGAHALLDQTTRDEAVIPDAETMDQGKALAGMRVVVTRDEDADGPLSSALRDAGAEPILMPLIAEDQPSDREPLLQAVRAIERYDWIVLSSMRGAEALALAIREQGKSLKEVRARIACVGPKTAESLRQATDRAADVVADEAGAAGLLDVLRRRSDVAGSLVLYPRSEQALPVLREGLEAMGARVDDPVAYRTTRGKGFEMVETIVREGHCDAVTFASPSAVEYFVEALGREKAEGLSRRILMASIGPTTSKVMAAHGMKVGVEGKERTYAGLVAALIDAGKP